ncbi:hypothetical protein DIE18_03460 [Burkholderia sp. Bp9125]|nr:hypothetical protein DIE18_03460 [Burkholderia sp. Bp9125]
MLWPLTLVTYLLGDLVVDVARSVWFALRDWIHRRWATGMTEYLEDDALCRAHLAQLQGEETPATTSRNLPRFREWRRPNRLV